MTRTTWLAALAVLSLVLAVPTAAVALGESDTTEAVKLTPKSEYATIESGELALDFDRLNEDATTSVDAVFEVTVRSTSAEELWIDHNAAGVTFYANGDRGDEIEPGAPLVVGAGETVTVGMSIDTHDAPTGEEPFSIVVAGEDDEAPDDTGAPTPTGGPLVVTNASVDATNVSTGDPVGVTATVANPSEMPATGTVEVFVDEAVIDDRRVALAPGENRTVEFSWTPRKTGVHEVIVGSATAGTVAVSDRAGFTFDSIDLSSPLTAAVAPPAGLSLLFLGIGAKGRRR